MSLLDDFKQMYRIRAVETALTTAFDDGLVPGLLHPAFGGEALAVGVSSRLDLSRDYIFSSHRCHGHAIAGGIDLESMIKEIMGHPDGINKGHAGTQHLNDFGTGFISGNGIVGAQVPLALGAAMTARHKAKRGKGGIAVVFFGDGAINQGGVMESMNLAVVQKLPVLFVLENNGMAQSTLSSTSAAGQGYAARADAFGLNADTVDGRDIEKVQNIMAKNIDSIRAGNPFFLEASIDRLCGHFHSDDQKYLREQKSFGTPDDPMIIAEELLQKNSINFQQIQIVKDNIDVEIAALYAAAKTTDNTAGNEVRK